MNDEHGNVIRAAGRLAPELLTKVTPRKLEEAINRDALKPLAVSIRWHVRDIRAVAKRWGLVPWRNAR